MLSFCGKSLLTLTFMSEWELADVWIDYGMCIRIPTKDKLCDKPLKTGLLKDMCMYGRKLKANKNGMSWNNEGLAMAISYDFSVFSVNKLPVSGWDQVLLLCSIFFWVAIWTIYHLNLQSGQLLKL